MEPRRIACLLAASLLLVGGPAPALVLTWDANTGVAGAQDGAGTWNTANNNWWTGAANATWNNATPDQAVFGAGSGAAGTVSLGVPITSGNITFSAPGSGNYTVSGSTLTLSGTPTIAANVNATIGSILGGTGFSKAGAGTLTLSSGAASTFTGNVTVNAGAVAFTVDNQLGNTANDILLDGGALNYNSGSADWDPGNGRVITIGAAGGTLGGSRKMYLNDGNQVRGAGTLTKGGTNILQITGNNAGATPFTGNVIVTGGTLELGNANALGTGAGQTITVNGGEVAAAGVTVPHPITIGANSVTLSSNANDSSAFSGAITGGAFNFNIGLRQFWQTTAARTLTISNSISGSGTISLVGPTSGSTLGTLILSGDNSANTGSITVGSRAALRLTNANAAPGAAGRTILVNSGGVAAAIFAGLQAGLLDRTNTASAGTLALTANTAEALDFTSLPSAYLGATATVDYTGTLTPGGTTYRLGGGGGTLTLPNANALTGGRSLVIGGGSAGTVVLSADSDYTGGTTILAANTLRVGSYSRLGSGNLTFDGGTLQFAAGSPFDLSARTVTIAAGGGTLDTNGSDVAFANSIGNGGSGAFTKTGLGTLTLNGASTYTGATTIKRGGVTLGVANGLPSGTALTMGDTASTANAGTLDLSGTYSQTLSRLVMTTVSDSNAALNTITNIGAGQALTVSSSAADDRVYLLEGTRVTISGAGALNVSAPNGNLRIEGYRGGTGATYYGMDLSGLGTFTANVNNAYVGYDPDNSAHYGSLLMADTNTLTATNAYVGYSTQTGALGGRLVLGTDNTLNVTTLYAGYGKANGTVEFRTGLTDPELIIRGKTGGASRANVTLGLFNQDNSGTNPTGTLDITAAGSSIDAMIDTLRLGSMEENGNSTTNGATGNFTFNDGTVDVNNVVVGRTTAAATQGRARGFLTMNGGTLTVNTSFVLAQRGEANANTSLYGTFTLSGGAATLNCDLADGGGTAGGSTTFVLDGGTLDMTNHAIGSATYPIDTLTFASGGLQNVSEINGGAALVKTSAGTLTLGGANTYTGTTVVNAGTLAIDAEQRLGNDPASFNAAQLTLNGGTLQATASFAIDDANRGITLGASGGAISVDDALTLTVANLVTGAGGLAKRGLGTLILGANNNYAGTTAVEAGTLSTTTPSSASQPSPSRTTTAPTMTSPQTSSATRAIKASCASSPTPTPITPTSLRAGRTSKSSTSPATPPSPRTCRRPSSSRWPGWPPTTSSTRRCRARAWATTRGPPGAAWPPACPTPCAPSWPTTAT